MKIYPISVTKKVNATSFRGAKFTADVPYKKQLQRGLKDFYGITCKLSDLDSIVGPNELKYIINNLKPKFYEIGENFRAQFHLHTKDSDGSLTLKDYLEQCVDWANHIFKNPKHRDNLPPFSASITDHDSAENVKRAVAEISQNPERYKNFKFVTGCEFMFDGYKKPFTAFEAVGLGFNPFDEDIQPLIAGQRIAHNKVSDIAKVKNAGGVLSLAHPLVTPHRLDDDFFSFLKENGVEGVEGNYQYIHWDTEYVETIKPIVEKFIKKYGLFSTGGTDTHRANIFK